MTSPSRRNKFVVARVVAIIPAVACLFMWSACHREACGQQPSATKLHFEAALKDFPREEKNLRKWDAPVIADLDQDGYPDLVLNDHGFGVRIAWNNEGRFAKPYDLIMGDMHGVTIGDFDQDGNLELVISRGGGSGKNARNAKMFRVSPQREFTELPNFDVPLHSMRGRTVKFFDGDGDGDLDLLNFAFPDKEKKGESENYIYENDGAEQLLFVGTLPATKRNGQKTLLTDFNQDGNVDLLVYGDGPIAMFAGIGGLNFKQVTASVLPAPIKDVTSALELDFDNDGDFDLFLTRGIEFQAGETYFNKETSTWGFYTTRGPFRFEDLVIGEVIEIENYQAQWPNKSVRIGESAYEYEFPGETHSGRDFRLVNSDGLGWPDNPNEKGAYLGYVGNDAWRLAGDIWSPTTGIVHGVRSYPDCEHAEGMTDVLLENRDGKFFDVTQAQNLQAQEHTTGATVGDFDNDGFVDLLIIRRGELVRSNRSLLYRNQRHGGFTLVESHNLVSPELGAIGLGANVLDYNRDGRVDVVIGNERGKWHLFSNETDSGHSYLAIRVGKSPKSKSNALGALVTVTASNVPHVRRLGGTSASYSLDHNPTLHFGLGNTAGPVKVKVRWTNGEVEERDISTLNTISEFGTLPKRSP